MQTINLINPAASDIRFEYIYFPDGEPHLKLLTDIDRKQEVNVIARICNPSQLFILLQLGDILDRMAVIWGLHISYLMSMRMDRVISFNEAFSLKVVTNMLNQMNFQYAMVTEPHSSTSIFMLKNSSASYPMEEHVSSTISPKAFVVFPDAGAAKRYTNSWNFNYYAACTKVRDLNTGKITSITIDEDAINSYLKLVPAEERQIVVLDDLCDAGGTFVGIAKLLDEKLPGVPRSIYITHLVNSKGVDNLCQNYTNVFVSNSYMDWTSNYKNFNVIDVI